MSIWGGSAAECRPAGEKVAQPADVHAFKLEQPALDVEAAGKARKGAVGAYHAVAGHDHTEPISAHGAADRPG